MEISTIKRKRPIITKINIIFYKLYKLYKVVKYYKMYKLYKENPWSYQIISLSLRQKTLKPINMAKVFTVSNVKGGVGKTTICSLLATYLTEQGITVSVLDADLQESLKRHRERDMESYPDTDPEWELERLDMEDDAEVRSIMKSVKELDGVVLIDCPGTLNDDNLQFVYGAADGAIVPISYDDDTIDATSLFVTVFRKLSNVPMLFVPNRINKSEGTKAEREQREETEKALNSIGKVMPAIKQTVAVKRYNTLFALDLQQRIAVGSTFEAIQREMNL